MLDEVSAFSLSAPIKSDKCPDKSSTVRCLHYPEYRPLRDTEGSPDTRRWLFDDWVRGRGDGYTGYRKEFFSCVTKKTPYKSHGKVVQKVWK